MNGLPSDITPARLTAMFRHADVLARGEVIEVTVEMSRETLISRIARLRLAYADAADGGPSHVFVKTRRAEAGPSLQRFGVKEAELRPDSSRAATKRRRSPPASGA